MTNIIARPPTRWQSRAMVHIQIEERPRTPPRGFALFSYGFRPFFLFAGIYAIVAMLFWLHALQGGPWPMAGLAPLDWHKHEMLFGVVAAPIGGFLLTAVPNWTGERGFGGRPLIVLFAAWLAGRVAMAPGLGVPTAIAAAVDLLYFPALALTLAPSLIRARKPWNLPFPVFLGVLFAANLLFHGARLGWWKEALADVGIHLGVDMVLVMVAIIGGRIIPSFTMSGLRREGISVTIAPKPALEAMAIGAIVAVLVVDLTWPDGVVAGWVALLAAFIHALRLSRWHGLKTTRVPILWVLHAAYGWLVIGLLLKALWLLLGVEFASKWIHALSIGAFAGMILAVMTRASLGHTGRNLIALPPVIAAYWFINLAAALRVLAALAGEHYMIAVAAAGFCWLAAFGLFVWVYFPILTQPRVDGRPG